MDYNELLKPQDFSSLKKIADWMEKAQKAISDLIIENQSLRNAANGFKRSMEKVEKERDEAIHELHGKCSCCKNYSAYHRKGRCKNCMWDNDNPACLREYQDDCWEWKGIKKEEK